MGLGKLTIAAVEEIGMSLSLAEEIKHSYLNAPDDRFATFLRTAHRLGLDIQARQIYMICRKTRNEEKWSIETSIDGFRVIADRTGCYAPGRETVWDANEKDIISATVFAKKLVGGAWHEVSGTAFMTEYNANNFMWQKMPRTMIAKCAEALCLRKAFPAQLSGIYTSDEMAQADNPANNAVIPKLPPQSQAPSKASHETITDLSPKTKQQIIEAEYEVKQEEKGLPATYEGGIPPSELPPKPKFEGNPIATSLMKLVTAKQLGMIRAISREMGIDPDDECGNALNCKCDELSKNAASFFIGHLQDLQKERESRATSSPNVRQNQSLSLVPPTGNDVTAIIDEIEELIKKVGGDDEESRKVILNGRNLTKMPKDKLIAFRDDLRSM